MYDELVKRLWECASGECFNCSQYTETTNASACSKELMKQAADAIEALSASVEGFEAQTNMVLDRDGNNTVIRFEPKWIPVTERLPKYGERVLVFGGVTMYVAYYDKNRYGGESWHKLNIKSHYCNPTHWMPLPQPPEDLA